jgi:hypothetical protein
MKIHTPGSAFVPRRIALYGPAKSGKTRLATSLPWGSDWGDKAIYVAWDPGSEELGSVLSANHPHLIVVRPEKPLSKAGGKYDPLGEAVKIATHDWKKDSPMPQSSDTATETESDLLAAYADFGQFSDKHVSFGKPGSRVSFSANEGGLRSCPAVNYIHSRISRPTTSTDLLFHDELVEPKENMVALAVLRWLAKAGTKSSLAATTTSSAAPPAIRVPGKTGADHSHHPPRRAPQLSGFATPPKTPCPSSSSTNPVHF